MAVNARRVVAHAVVGFYVVAVTTGVVLQIAGGARSTDLIEGLTYLAAFGLFAVLGALLIARRPGHVMGPLFATVGLLPAIGFPGETYAALQVIGGGTTPLWARLLAWPNTFYWYVVLAIVVVYVPLLFPDGHLPSRRWRWVVWTVGVGVFILSAISAVAEGILLQTRGPDGAARWIDNPFGVPGMPYGEDNPLFEPVGSVIVLGALGAIAAVVVRFRRSRGVERQQFKWFLAPVCLVGLGVIIDVLPLPLPAWVSVIGAGATLLGVLGLPVSITLAIMRFRLYEIDRLISRTVTYALVTATLLVTYTAIATLPGVIFRLRSDVLVAAATLAAAAVFVPVRRWVQRAVDRRFNRARYDAEQVVARFGSQLRGDLRVDRLQHEIAQVVASTVQPAHVALWIRRQPEAR